MESIISPRQPPKVAAVQARRKIWMPFTRGEHWWDHAGTIYLFVLLGEHRPGQWSHRDRRVKITDAHQGSRMWNEMSIPVTG
ncbi:hypothetical protein, partial [Mesorhizobium sp. LSJC264A00]|uniref:hypothetical protein n=1 Tax=Mesorhizobium sp. LSJC264A00 TaxID=1287321 RepID=UPI001AEBE2EC